MNSIRIKFTRGEEVRYISHLDLMKTFERALRRSRIPIAYSQGFNPHPQMVFGLPLSVGVTSETEYADFELANPLEPEELVERLNKELPAGLKIITAKYKHTRDNIMASVVRASYDIMAITEPGMEINDYQKKVNEFLEKQSIIVKRQGKNGIREVDIRPMIHSLTVKEGSREENMLWFSMLVSAGSAANLKPELLISTLSELGNLKIRTVKIHRSGLFVNKEGKTLEPLTDAVLTDV